MKRKTFLFLIATLLVAILACALVACNVLGDDSNDKETNNNDTTTPLPEITFTEDMTIDEIVDVLVDDVKSLKYHLTRPYYNAGDDYQEIVEISQNAYSRTILNYDGADYANNTFFIDNTTLYGLACARYYNYEDIEAIACDYRGYDYDFNATPLYCADFNYFDKVEIREELNSFDSLKIENNTLLFIEDGYSLVLSGFNTTTVTIPEYYGDFKSYATKREFVEFKPKSDDECECIGDYMPFITQYSIPEVADGHTVTMISGFSSPYLTSISIPSTVTYISFRAFENCINLNINYNGTMEEWDNIDKEYEWDKKSGIFTIHCTDGSIDINYNPNYS